MKIFKEISSTKHPMKKKSNCQWSSPLAISVWWNVTSLKQGPLMMLLCQLNTRPKSLQLVCFKNSACMDDWSDIFMYSLYLTCVNKLERRNYQIKSCKIKITFICCECSESNFNVVLTQRPVHHCQQRNKMKIGGTFIKHVLSIYLTWTQ